MISTWVVRELVQHPQDKAWYWSTRYSGGSACGALWALVKIKSKGHGAELVWR